MPEEAAAPAPAEPEGSETEAAGGSPGRLVFDHTSAEVQGPRYWEALRELRRKGPLVWVESHGGYWAATTYDMVVRIAQDWETFSSSRGTNILRPTFEELAPIVPVEIDPPRQRAYRHHVNPYLTMKSLAELEPAIRGIANDLIDTFISNGACDISIDFAQRFPGTVFFRLMVHCGDEDFRWVEPFSRMISFESTDPEKFARGGTNIRAWAARVFDERGDHAEIDDVVSALMGLDESGESFTEEERCSALQNLATGGIGTSASMIGVAMRVLAEDPALQERVHGDPSLIQALVEECLRLEPAVSLQFRRATRDVEIAGQRVRKGDWVALFFGAANRDPAIFERPDELVLDRPHMRHIGFGAGVHRCLGSNLARLQIRVAVEQLVARLSPFSIPAGAEIQYLSLQARGPISIPLHFSVGTEV
jgi:cytochrome P450